MLLEVIPLYNEGLLDEKKVNELVKKHGFDKNEMKKMLEKYRKYAKRKQKEAMTGKKPRKKPGKSVGSNF